MGINGRPGTCTDQWCVCSVEWEINGKGSHVNDDNIEKPVAVLVLIRFDNQQTTMTSHVTRRVQCCDGV